MSTSSAPRSPRPSCASLQRAATTSPPQPRPHGFPGLRPGDRWCLCAARWQEAIEAGVAHPLVLEATDDAALAHVRAEDLSFHAVESADSQPALVRLSRKLRRATPSPTGFAS